MATAKKPAAKKDEVAEEKADEKVQAEKDEAEQPLEPKVSAPNPYVPEEGETKLQAPGNRSEEESKTEITLTDGSSVTVDVPFAQVEQKLRDKNLVTFSARGSDESVQVNPASVASVKPA